MTKTQHVIALCGAALVLLSAPAARGQELRAPANLAIEPIRGFADLSAEFRESSSATEQVVQGKEVEIVVTIKSAATGVKYVLKDAVQISPEPPSADRTQHAIRSLQLPRLISSGEDSGHRLVEQYLITMAIASGAQPRHYDIQLTFDAPNKAPLPRYITLSVGALEQEQFVNATAESQTPVITAGEESPLSLSIVNKYSTYALRLKRLEVRSQPPGLIEDVSQTSEIHIPAGQTRRLTVNVRGRRSLQQLLSPLASKPRLNVLLVYDDGYRDGLERIPQIPIEFDLAVSTQLTVIVTSIALLGGAIIGAWMRIRFGTADTHHRRLPRGERVLASIVLSGVVILLVVGAKVEIVAKSVSWQLPMYSPTVILLLSFAVGLYDPHDLVTTLKNRFGIGTPQPAK